MVFKSSLIIYAYLSTQTIMRIICETNCAWLFFFCAPSSLARAKEFLVVPYCKKA